MRAAFPVDGPGMVHNPDRAPDPARPTRADLAAGRVGHAGAELVERLGDRLDPVEHDDCAQLYRAGEWDELGKVLAARQPVMTPEERALLADLTG